MSKTLLHPVVRPVRTGIHRVHWTTLTRARGSSGAAQILIHQHHLLLPQPASSSSIRPHSPDHHRIQQLSPLSCPSEAAVCPQRWAMDDSAEREGHDRRRTVIRETCFALAIHSCQQCPARRTIEPDLRDCHHRHLRIKCQDNEAIENWKIR